MIIGLGMVDETKSERVYRIGILVIVVALVPVALYLLKALFLRAATPVVVSSAVVSSSVSTGTGSDAPTIDLKVRKKAGKLDVTLSITNGTGSDYAKVSTDNIKVGGVVVVKSMISFGPVKNKQTVTKTWTIPMPPKLVSPVEVDYDIDYSNSPSSSGGSSGMEMVSVE